MPLAVGDFVADTRRFYILHANTSENKRTCLTMWYYLAFQVGRTQASIAAAEAAMEHGLSQLSSPTLAAKLAPFEIRYHGREKPFNNRGTCHADLPNRLPIMQTSYHFSTQMHGSHCSGNITDNRRWKVVASTQGCGQ